MLGKYRLVEEIGRGGMGIVWLAEASGPGGFAKRVVVKELRPELARDPAYRTMFLEEARLAARLHHRNVVQTYEVGCADGRWFMVLEHLEGASLADAEPLVRMTLGARVRIVADVLAGLHHAHELAGLGVVHRDVSPRNVFLTVQGEVKLLDFGVAKCRDRAQETQHGVLKGSVAYMTSVHVAGASIDRRADVFAAGVLLRELVTGARLWGDRADVEILRSLVAKEIPPFPACPVPDDLRAICERAMAVDRADRFPTADAMRDALERWLDESAPRSSLVPVGAALARALDRRAKETTELPSSALVTDVTRAPRRDRTALSMALAGILGLAALVGGASALVHDAVPDPRADLAAASITPAELPVPTVAPNVEPPRATAAVTSPDEPVAPELPPNPYEPDSI